MLHILNIHMTQDSLEVKPWNNTTTGVQKILAQMQGHLFKSEITLKRVTNWKIDYTLHIDILNGIVSKFLIEYQSYFSTNNIAVVIFEQKGQNKLCSYRTPFSLIDLLC